MRLDLLIVGASFAGLAAARTAASRGLAVAVIDAKREPGAPASSFARRSRRSTSLTT
jgi:flavin-dependent dehydrogenase